MPSELQLHLPRAILSELIDYAGLFPPAQLPMQSTVDNFAGYLGSSTAWMLGRLIVPLARMPEFVEAWKTMALPLRNAHRWKISCLLPATTTASVQEMQSAIANTHDLGRRIDGTLGSDRMPFEVDSLELAPVEPDAILHFAQALPETMRGFVEIPLPEVEHFVPTLHAFPRLSAKLRLGGVQKDNFPTSWAVVSAVRLLVRETIRFKATAGLHHPLPGDFPLTYDVDAPRGHMHGFFSLLCVVAGARKGLPATQLAALLDEENLFKFNLTNDGIGWRSVFLTWPELEQARQESFVSFGSCSFTEPVEDLQQMGWLQR